MCGGSSAPKAPPALPEAAVLPEAPTEAATGSQSADARRRRRATGGRASTILTGARGTTQSAATATKTLLGQ